MEKVHYSIELKCKRSSENNTAKASKGAAVEVTVLNKKDKLLYKAHLLALQKEDPEVTLILDATEEEVDWLNVVRRKKRKKEER